MMFCITLALLIRIVFRNYLFAKTRRRKIRRNKETIFLYLSPISTHNEQAVAPVVFCPLGLLHLPGRHQGRQGAEDQDVLHSFLR